MRVLVIGSGGREHALAWKLQQSPLVNEVYCAPGNPGMASLADCVSIDPSEIVELADFAEKLSIDLTVVGPELPLMLGLVDEFKKRGLRAFGPSRLAAELEGSKAFAKEFMQRHGVPTARFQIANTFEHAQSIIDKKTPGLPFVVKADGLAGGKGVTVAHSREEALAATKAIMQQRTLGSAGDRLVLEEFLEGDEVSFFAFSDGSNVLPLVAAQDHKAAFDGDEGPNTGGMGCICPATMMKAETLKRILQEIVFPTISGLAAEGRRYQGLLYFGLMVTAEGPKVLEFNVRFGDPEAQALLPRLKADLFPLLKEVAEGRLGQHKLEWMREPAVTIVLASGGYPGHYEVGKPIEGVDRAKGVEVEEGVYLFHAGTRQSEDTLVTAGGRVLAVTGVGQNLRAAIDRAYTAVGRIRFDGMHYRTDIGHKALARLSGGAPSE
ncbi:MAG: phosphoribosylamine--glycine ligase [Acidobacteriota bacterium]